MTFLLDDDCIEVEGMPCDKMHERAMARSSMAMMCALNAARGLSPPQRPHGQAIELPPLPRELVERYVRRPDTRERPVLLPWENVSRSIIRSVAEAMGLAREDLTGTCRSRRLVCARMIASRLLRDLKWPNGEPRFSLPQIGRIMHRDHSTICYHLQVFDAYCRKYPFMRAVYQALGGGEP